MTCARFEREIALWVGNELSMRRAHHVETHVACCEACRALAEQVRADRVLVAEMACAGVDSAMLAEVRKRALARVREEASARRPTMLHFPAGFRWAMGLAAAALVLAAAGVLVMRRTVGIQATVSASAPRLMSVPSAVATRPAAEAGASPQLQAGVSAVSAPAIRRVASAALRPRARANRPARASETADRQATAEPLVIKLLTDDPDVVIYWLVDQQKG